MAINEKQKWPTNKKQYDKNWLTIYGKKCPVCKNKPRGVLAKYGEGWTTCPKCNGLGYVEQSKWER